MRTWFALLGAPFLALADQSVSYATVGWSCAHQHTLVVHAVHGVFLAAIVLATLLAASAGLYAAGVTKLWRRAGAGRGIRPVEVARFTAGWLLLAATLAPPVDALAERSFAVHMMQHEFLMVAAAPLLVL